jgi:hypothetical protein
VNNVNNANNANSKPSTSAKDENASIAVPRRRSKNKRRRPREKRLSEMSHQTADSSSKSELKALQVHRRLISFLYKDV